MNPSPYKIIIAALITCCAITQQQTNATSARVIPLSFNQQTNDWSVLLRLNPQSNWWEDFYVPMRSRERGNIAAARALYDQTSGTYSYRNRMLPPGTPWRKTASGDIVHFLKVEFKPGRKLFSCKNQYSADFVWIPLQEIVNSSGDIKRPSRGQLKNVSRGVLGMMRRYTPSIVRQLDVSTNTMQQTQASQSQPTLPSGSQNIATGSMSNVQTSWRNVPAAIYFYDRTKPYYEFTNFYHAPIIINGKQWPTSEHYYQAQKFAGTPLEEQIRTTQGARDVFNLAQANKHKVRPNWQSISLETMLTALREKFKGGSHRAQTLLNTGNKVLIEDAGKNDAFFGAGADYQGSNYLGQLLMHVRHELKNGQQSRFIGYKTPTDYFKNNP